MDFKELINNLLKENMTENCFALWQLIDRGMPNIWDRPTSSTGKYHKKLNGEIPKQAEHVYHILFCTVKLLRMFNLEPKTPEADKLLLAGALHDSLKYGKNGQRPYVDNQHDRSAGNFVSQNKELLLKIFTEEQFFVLEEAVRFHTGRFSSDVSKNMQFDFKNYNPETMFLHMLDFMSTLDLIQTDVRD